MSNRRLLGTCILTLVVLGGSASCRRGGPQRQVQAAEVQPPTAPAQPAPANAGGVTPKTQAPPAVQALSRAFATAAAALRPSVVRVDVDIAPKKRRGGRPRSTTPEDFFRRFFEFGPPEGMPEPTPGPAHGTGSGVILDDAGHILTNGHVVEAASKVKVTLPDGRSFDGKTVGVDPWTDIAVLKLEKPPAGLVAARLGDSDKLETGEWVLAVGSPLGLEQTVTAGIVSGMGHVGGPVQMSGQRVRRYIQTDANINPGNSGGPLVNLSSEVVGINTLIDTGPGGAYGFAIPINEARKVATSLIKEGRVRYAFLGVLVGSVKDLPPEQKGKLGANPPTTGAFVSSVTPDGPAAKAGIQEGDVITAVDGQKVEKAGDVIDQVSGKAIGARVSISLLRDGKARQVEATLGELKSPEQMAAAAGNSGRIGVALQSVTPEIARMLGLDASVRGAVVTEVQPDSPADAAGIQAGDVILEVDQKRVASADEAISALRAPGKNGQHLLRLRSAQGTRFVTVKPE